jgi:hypothetical protein
MTKMIRNIILASLLVMAACNSKTKTTDTGEKSFKDSFTILLKDSVSVTGQVNMGKIDMESFGTIKLGQHYSKTLEAIGQPDSKSKPVEWAADGLFHEDWTWKENGMAINMSFDNKNIDSTLSVFSITAKAPCDFKTKAGIGIGSRYAEAEAAYKNSIDPYTTNKDQITVGDLYDGIIFSFKDDKVIKIFLGAAAE